MILSGNLHRTFFYYLFKGLYEAMGIWICSLLPIPSQLNGCLIELLKNCIFPPFFCFLSYGEAECNMPSFLRLFAHPFPGELGTVWLINLAGGNWAHLDLLLPLFFLRTNCLQGVCALLLSHEGPTLPWLSVKGDPCPTQQCLRLGRLVCVILGSILGNTLLHWYKPHQLSYLSNEWHIFPSPSLFI